MLFNLILVVLILILSVIFALQNSTIVSLKIFGFSTNQSLALILVVAFLLGVIFSLLFMIPYYFRYRKKMNELKRTIKEKEKEIKEKNETSTLPEAGEEQPE